MGSKKQSLNALVLKLTNYLRPGYEFGATTPFLNKLVKMTLQPTIRNLWDFFNRIRAIFLKNYQNRKIFKT